jgi:hypothetical protein
MNVPHVKSSFVSIATFIYTKLYMFALAADLMVMNWARPHAIICGREPLIDASLMIETKTI